MMHNLEFLRKEFLEKGKEMKRTVFFVDSIAKTHELNIKFRGMLPNKGKVGDGWYISEHHSSVTEDEAKRDIKTDFADELGHTKVLFSTISYGMGKIRLAYEHSSLECEMII
jgi:hypothetical protein